MNCNASCSRQATCLEQLPFVSVPTNFETEFQNLSIQGNTSIDVPDETISDSDSSILLDRCHERIQLIISIVKIPKFGHFISPPLKRKLLSLPRYKLLDEKERSKAIRTTISIANRTATELLMKFTDSNQMIPNLWNAVRNRGCQFLGPAIQEEILSLVLLALEDGDALTRKVLILFVMQRLQPHFPYQASKTAIGHVIQILYRASCFEVIKREGESSLMQLKEEYRTYESLRKEHDTQIVSIALEAGLRISPEQWSSLLYGDNRHKSHMQSIIDKLNTTKPSLDKLVNKLKVILSKTDDPAKLYDALQYFEQLASFEIQIERENFSTLHNVMLAIDAVNFIMIKFITLLRVLYQKQTPC